MRDGWKYACTPGTDWLLFNTSDDPYEQANYVYDAPYQSQKGAATTGSHNGSRRQVMTLLCRISASSDVAAHRAKVDYAPQPWKTSISSAAFAGTEAGSGAPSPKTMGKVRPVFTERVPASM